MRRFGTVVLAVLALALAGVIGLELRPGPKSSAEPAPRRAAAASGSALVVTNAAQDPAWSDTILARPLFAATRRPTTRAAPVAEPVAPPPALPRLAGIVIIGGKKSVIFAADGDRRPITVAEGDEFNGFRVEAIENGRVTVTGSGGRQVLRPSFDLRAPAPVAVAVLPSAPPPPGPPGPGSRFNGPPGLDRMSRQPPPGPSTAAPGAVLPGLPGVSLNATTGIPGLTPPTAPAPR